MIPFWCLMPKEEKLRPKQMDQLPLVNFKNNRVRIFDLSKILLLQNLVFVEENFDYGKKGEFWHLIIFTLGITLYVPKQVCLICKNKPSGGKERSKYAKL
jgi:hypothetical protein